MMTDEIGPLGVAFLAASQLREAAEDLSAQDINRLPMADYAKIRERAGLPTSDPFTQVYSSAPPGRPRQARAHRGPTPEAAAAAQHQGTDFSQIGMAEYGRVREQLGIGRSPSARGLFD